MRKILCLLGFHKWEIRAYSTYKGKMKTGDGFWRYCERCDRIESLQRPKEYHPTKYVWTEDNDLFK